MGRLLPMVKARFFDANGDPLAGGKVYSYIAGTSTPLVTYSDDEVTPNTNPVILDANGEADIWLASASNYKIVLKDSDDVTQWTVDDVPGTASSGSSSAGGWGAWATHSVTQGAGATALSGQTWTAADYTTVIYEFEVIRGTAINASGRIYLQKQNSSWRVVEASYSGEAHGITWSLTGTTTQQLNAAADAGDNATIKLSRRLVS